jgi:uncharacterized membrane protein YjjP (DUF1212 family)
MSTLEQNNEIKALGSTLLEIGALLMISGASTNRIRMTVDRISNSFGYSTDMMISQRNITLNIRDEENDHLFNSLKRTSPHGINFVILSSISKMSWKVVEEKWSVDQINEEIKRLVALPHYPRLAVLSFVALAGSAFCRLAGGGWVDLILVFIGSFIGLYIRQEATKQRFNTYLCVYFAAFTSTLIVGLAYKLDVLHTHEHAFATSVLFLIPGVPLINSFSDLIDGNLHNGLIRGLNGFIIAFSIAMGLLTSMFIYQL